MNNDNKKAIKKISYHAPNPPNCMVLANILNSIFQSNLNMEIHTREMSLYKMFVVVDFFLNTHPRHKYIIYIYNSCKITNHKRIYFIFVFYVVKSKKLNELSAGAKKI